MTGVPGMETAPPFPDEATFAAAQPHIHYAYKVSAKLASADHALVSLQSLQKFLEPPLNLLPIVLNDGHRINREEWLRAAVDLLLFRSMAVQDAVLHLVNEVFGRPFPEQVKLKATLRLPRIIASELVAPLSALASVGDRLREERNRRAHEGIGRPFSDDSFLFKVHAMSELRDNASHAQSAFAEQFEVERNKIRNDLNMVGDELHEKSMDVIDVLLDVFNDEFTVKRNAFDSAK